MPETNERLALARHSILKPFIKFNTGGILLISIYTFIIVITLILAVTVPVIVVYHRNNKWLNYQVSELRKTQDIFPKQ